MSCSIKSVLTQAQRKAVSVNGAVIAHDLISRETQNHPAANPVLAWTAATRALVVRELLLQEAKRIGLCTEPRVDDMGRRETEAEALVRGVIETQVRAPIPDAESCRRYYDANAARFRSSDIFECAHILIAACHDDTGSFTAARQRADRLLLHLCERPGDFSALASSHSDCPSGAVGGNLGQVTPGATTPEFEAALGRCGPAQSVRSSKPVMDGTLFAWIGICRASCCRSSWCTGGSRPIWRNDRSASPLPSMSRFWQAGPR